MLQSMDAKHIECTVFRLTSWEHIEHFFENQNANPERMNQVSGLLTDLPNRYKFNQPEPLEEILLDPIFRPKGKLEKFRTKGKLEKTNFGRFSSDTVAVFYSALDMETAEAEVCYQHKQFSIRGLEDQEILSWGLFSCKFSGSIKDIQAFVCPQSMQDDDQNGDAVKQDNNAAIGYEFCTCKVPESDRDLRLFVCPKLTQNEGVDDGYQFCQELGKEAVQECLDGLLAPSARNLGGTNLPVFLRKAISNPQLRYRVDTAYDQEHDSVYPQKRDF